MGIDKIQNTFISSKISEIKQSATQPSQAIPAYSADSFENKSQKETFLQKHWGKLLLALVAVAGVASYTFRSKLTKAATKAGEEASDTLGKAGGAIPDLKPNGQFAGHSADNLKDINLNPPAVAEKMAESVAFQQETAELIANNFANLKVKATETITAGDDAAARVSNFLSNPEFHNGMPLRGTGLTPLTSKFDLEPHQYNTTAQDILFVSRTRTQDYPQNTLKLSGDKQIYHTSSGLVRHFNGGIPCEYPHFVIGKTPDGRAFVEYAIQSNRSDGGRIIRERATIVSKDGNFTPVQIDLMKTLGSYKNTPDLKEGYFPMLSVAKEHAVSGDVAERLRTGVTGTYNGECVAVSEDVLLSSIHTWAENTTQADNKFLQGYSKLKNGESIAEDLSGLIVSKEDSSFGVLPGGW